MRNKLIFIVTLAALLIVGCSNVKNEEVLNSSYDITKYLFGKELNDSLKQQMLKLGYTYTAPTQQNPKHMFMKGKSNKFYWVNHTNKIYHEVSFLFNKPSVNKTTVDSAENCFTQEAIADGFKLEKNSGILPKYFNETNKNAIRITRMDESIGSVIFIEYAKSKHILMEDVQL